MIRGPPSTCFGAVHGLTERLSEVGECTTRHTGEGAGTVGWGPG